MESNSGPAKLPSPNRHRRLGLTGIHLHARPTLVSFQQALCGLIEFRYFH